MDGSRKARTPDELHIKRSMNGGFIVRHSYDNSYSGPSYQQPTEHVFSDHGKLMSHVKKHTGGKPDVSGEMATPTQKAAPTPADGKRASTKRGAGVD